MKKFSKPFDAYQIGSERPMAIELNPQGVARYKALADNPLYYFNALQYTNGGFYRAVLGYEVIWDSKYERRLELSLDFILNHHAKRTEYYLEEIVFEKALPVFKGVRWRRGVKPRVNFSMTWREPIKAGTRALARVNLLDVPHHVDIEFYESGEIFTVSYSHFMQWKRSHIRSLDHAKSPTKTKPNGEARTPKSSRLPFPSGKLPDNVLDLRERLRRAQSLQKTRTENS